jgi:hypothetical protein
VEGDKVMNWKQKKSEFLEIFLQIFAVTLGIFLIFIPIVLGAAFSGWWFLALCITVPIAITMWEMVARYNHLSIFW